MKVVLPGISYELGWYSENRERFREQGIVVAAPQPRLLTSGESGQASWPAGPFRPLLLVGGRDGPPGRPNPLLSGAPGGSCYVAPIRSGQSSIAPYQAEQLPAVLRSPHRPPGRSPRYRAATLGP